MDDSAVPCAILVSPPCGEVCNVTVQHEKPIQELGWLLFKCSEGDLNYQYTMAKKCKMHTAQLSVFVLHFLFIHMYLEPMAGR